MDGSNRTQSGNTTATVAPGGKAGLGTYPQTSTPATADLSNNSGGAKEPRDKRSKRPPQPFGEESPPEKPKARTKPSAKQLDENDSVGHSHSFSNCEYEDCGGMDDEVNALRDVETNLRSPVKSSAEKGDENADWEEGQGLKEPA